MIVRHLTLSDFRNYAAADVELAPGTNLFIGRNGQGKTNLVEAIGYLSTLGSHRVSSDQAMIRAGRDSAIIRTRLEHNGRDLLAEVQINRSTPNRAQVNRGQIKPRELPRYFSSVLFAPEDLGIVRGDPSARRKFADQLIVLRTPRMAGVYADYDRTLRQRNTLLKSARGSGLKETQLSTLEVWDDKLIALGTEIIGARSRLVAEMAAPLQAAYRSVVGDDHGPRISLIMSVDGVDADDDGFPNAPAPASAPVSTAADGESGAASTGPGSAAALPTAAEVAEAFRRRIAERRRAELDRGVTLVGPHRDDLLFELNGLPVKGYASHGESWSFALSLKLASAELLRRESNLGDPVLILDDVFAELDQSRRRRLAEAISGYEQVLITAAVLDDVPEQLTARTVRIAAGEIVGTSDAVVSNDSATASAAASSEPSSEPSTVADTEPGADRG
ncbi:DNA replication/repair protein RecF [Leifsonia sp. ALI-44-B]|uniref:DNA replication/repair protein RecF n=1 Tax=Leifsonia sp. ALI-44-B TaxID=1933776 RepID=UPI00097C2216|nr:DNA replication/repair protein RecF [Leifsonia sp. ALI-44-B]ONI60945.1 DNA replication/repair protein RecF [Leifsonia sp. ALI-44-B]